MEPAECISEEWSSLSGFYTAEEADFMIQLLDSSSVSVLTNGLNGNSSLGIPSAFWPALESTLVSMTGINNACFSSSHAVNTNLLCLQQGNSCNSGSSTTSSENYSVQGIDHLNQESSLHLAGKGENFQQADRECEMLLSQPAEEDKSNNMVNSTKRSRSSTEAPENKRNVRSKKNPKSAAICNNANEEDRCPGLQGQGSSSCSSEDESNTSQELNGGASSSLTPEGAVAPMLNGKSTANRVPATDPQSLYARRRRERINERLRILQNLVPNGTKVDISTMLEEAVQYVKFLQLQIKVLSSDDLWMYAPIAYNGMDIGLDLNITPTKHIT
ncbi:hypothetical protein L6164_035773 [Bauhinia variegata]|uniref:Uncharacterized protein n=1 Tax=Bauhinia variegata TaxID=167791 RepID=A0ACB9KF26_BAUVA|nr:hypothetical protein L6164_035773 [Bauhinia variegata]